MVAAMTLNDRSNPLTFLATRRSARPRDLIGPGPSDEQLRQIIEIAARTPDHGRLFPWRFVSVANDQRGALADLLVTALIHDEPDAPQSKIEKARAFAHYEGALVVLIAAPVRDHKIPLIEQEHSVGAAGMNLLHAANAMSFTGGWVTGWAARSPAVTAAFCAPGERIAGFVFIGQPGSPLEERPRAPLATVWRAWNAPED